MFLSFDEIVEKLLVEVRFNGIKTLLLIHEPPEGFCEQLGSKLLDKTRIDDKRKEKFKRELFLGVKPDKRRRRCMMPRFAATQSGSRTSANNMRSAECYKTCSEALK